MSNLYVATRADEIAVGDYVLRRYYDPVDGAYVEEHWEAIEVRHRRYGRGLRVIISWRSPDGGTCERSMRPEVIFGKAVEPKPFSWRHP